MFKSNHTSPRRIMTGTALAGLTLNALAGANPSASTQTTDPSPGSSSWLAWQLSKPAWLTDVSVTVKETYDDNVLMVSGNGPMQPQASLVTTLAGKLGMNFAPLLGDTTPFQILSFVYNPEFDVYHNAPDETYSSHRVTDTIKGNSGDFSFNVENIFCYVDGSDIAPTYEGDDKYRSGFAGVVPKDRREQIQDRTKAAFQYDFNRCFIRPTASLLYYDMMTKLSDAAGYQNYPSRYDVNGGLDFGYHVVDNLAVTLGYRYGHQYQQMLPAAIDDTQKASGSDYQRVLLGLEGKPWSWLTIDGQAGPDFRNYEASAAVADDNDITYYAEASATAEIDANDSLSLKYKQWRWVSFTGRVPYFDSNYELTYHRKLTDRLSFDLTGRIAEYDFACAYDPAKLSNERNDYLYSIAPSLTFAVTRAFSITASGSIDFARNAQDNAPGGNEYREFDHNIASLSATYKF
jgi:hypothetical protein